MVPSGSNAVCRIVKPYSKYAFYVSAFDFPFRLFISIKHLTLYPDRIIVSIFSPSGYQFLFIAFSLVFVVRLVCPEWGPEGLFSDGKSSCMGFVTSLFVVRGLGNGF